MRYSRLIALAAMAAGMALCTSTAKAEDYYRDIRHDRRDLSGDYARANRLRADIAHDRYRLNEDIRCGRGFAAREEARDIARDRRALDHQLRDIRHDRTDLYWDRR